MELDNELKEVISIYFKNISTKVESYGSGLINRTFFLQNSKGNFLLQKINHHVFKNPEGLMQNIEAVSQHLTHSNYSKSILKIYPTLAETSFLKTKNKNYWRVFYFIENTQSYNIPISEKMVYDAANGFGEFLFYLKNIPSNKIVDTIPHFHNTSLRFQQFNSAIEKDEVHRVKTAKEVIQQVLDFSFLLKKIEELEPQLPTRIVHNDLKINNLLFTKDGQVKAVIDWDTIMQGNILYDFGDMVRTMACTENEESTDFEKVKINPLYLEQLMKGFSDATCSFLSKIENENLLLGGQFIIYEQAIRFLTDYLNGDIYYNTTYTNQNLNRAKNQLALLNDLVSI